MMETDQVTTDKSTTITTEHILVVEKALLPLYAGLTVKFLHSVWIAQIPRFAGSSVNCFTFWSSPSSMLTG